MLLHTKTSVLYDVVGVTSRGRETRDLAYELFRRRLSTVTLCDDTGTDMEQNTGHVFGEIFNIGLLLCTLLVLEHAELELGV